MDGHASTLTSGFLLVADFLDQDDKNLYWFDTLSRADLYAGVMLMRADVLQLAVWGLGADGATHLNTVTGHHWTYKALTS